MVAGLTSGQSLRAPTTSSAQLLALPQSENPISFEQIEEHSTRFADGTSRIEFSVAAKTFRDSAGGLRLESETRHGHDNVVSSAVSVFDPVAGSKFVLFNGTALRLPFPSSGEAQFFRADAADGQESPHKWTTKTENAGKKKIDGREFEGIRIITTAEDEPRPTTTIEEWHSRELKLIGSVDRSGPHKAYTVRIQNLRFENLIPGFLLYRLITRLLTFRSSQRWRTYSCHGRPQRKKWSPVVSAPRPSWFRSSAQCGRQNAVDHTPGIHGI